MRLGDMKAEALKLMFINLDNDINAESLADLLFDETYASYLVNMNGSVVRALNRMASARKLGTRSVELSEGAQRNGYVEYDLRVAVPDLLRIRTILCRKSEQISETNDWRMVGRKLILPKLHRPGDIYELVYDPKAPVISELNDVDELPLEEEAAQIIPYYIKGELFEDDEPNAAAQARNLFEQWLSDLPEQENEGNFIQVLF